jgi:hypothetical protein
MVAKKLTVMTVVAGTAKREREEIKSWLQRGEGE